MSDVTQVLYDKEVIASKVEELAHRISADYAGRELVLVCILKAAAIFTADLVRSLTVPVVVEFIQAASYGASTTPSRDVVIVQDLKTDIADRHVLLVDTIVDTGETLHALSGLLSKRNPASLRAAVLLDKKCRRVADAPVDYCGFEIPDAFVVGYGMDCGERFRNLPYIAVLESGA